ncbi:heme-binding protein [Methylobacterium sp. J-043]|nr:heme-binding protein [Methylobacterium sp. J-043]
MPKPNGQAENKKAFAGLAASPGGFPLVVEGRIVGAIGCSGGTGDQDTVVCQAGLAALT